MGDKVKRRAVAALAVCVLASLAFSQTPPTAPTWIDASNRYTNMLLAVQMKHNPEYGSSEGLSEFDTKVSQPTLANEDQERLETQAVLDKFKAAARQKQQEEVAQDLQLLISSIELGFRWQDFQRAHEVPFSNPSNTVFGGLRTLLDDQTPAGRRPAALTRLRAYAGLEPGYKPLAEIVKQRAIEQMGKPGVVYPSRNQIETELGRDSDYWEGIASLFTKYNLTGWQDAFNTLKTQLTDYDAWIRTTILPEARTDFRLPPEEYAMNLQYDGVDTPPDQIAVIAHQAFSQIQGEMTPIAAQIAQQHHLSSSDYREVMRALKKDPTDRRRDSAFLPKPTCRDRENNYRSSNCDAARSAGAYPYSHGRGNRAATRPTHGCSAIPEQHWTERRVRSAAQYTRRTGSDYGHAIRRFHL